jgi:hypothetical protein
MARKLQVYKLSRSNIRKSTWSIGEPGARILGAENIDSRMATPLPRGVSERTANGTAGTFANSNERARRGFAIVRDGTDMGEFEGKIQTD